MFCKADLETISNVNFLANFFFFQYRMYAQSIHSHTYIAHIHIQNRSLLHNWDQWQDFQF